MALSGREISGIFFDMSQIRLRFIVIALLAAATVTGAEPVWAHGVEKSSPRSGQLRRAIWTLTRPVRKVFSKSAQWSRSTAITL